MQTSTTFIIPPGYAVGNIVSTLSVDEARTVIVELVDSGAAALAQRMHGKGLGKIPIVAEFREFSQHTDVSGDIYIEVPGRRMARGSSELVCMLSAENNGSHIVIRPAPMFRIILEFILQVLVVVGVVMAGIATDAAGAYAVALYIVLPVVVLAIMEWNFRIYRAAHAGVVAIIAERVRLAEEAPRKSPGTRAASESM